MADTDRVDDDTESGQAARRIELRDENISWQELDGQVVVLDTARGTYLLLNASAAVLWAVVAAGATRSELVETLVSRYGLGQDTAQNDVNAFLHSLNDRALVKT
jgi:hypothetical protein